MGIFFPRPNEHTKEQKLEEFERAKAETLKHMRDALEQTEALTSEQFFATKTI